MKKLFFLSLLIFCTGIAAFAQDGIGSGSASYNSLNRGVLISARPKPMYTEQARKESIEGNVLLRVEFRSDGSIGEVTPIKPKKKFVKYGLVNQAINAAKRIIFEPARRHGKPVTVTKTVPFSFDLY